MQKEEKDLRDRTKAFALRIVRIFSAEHIFKRWPRRVDQPVKS
jgi:hypothetical protein